MGGLLVPPEVYNLILDSIKEVKSDIANLRDKMGQEHKELGDRVGKLEHDERVTRYIFCGAATLITLLLREFIPKIL